MFHPGGANRVSRLSLDQETCLFEDVWTASRYGFVQRSKAVFEALCSCGACEKKGKGKILLDLGCGEGSFFHQYVRCDFFVVGLDIDRGVLRSARRTMRRVHLEGSLLRADLSNIPLRDNCINVVVAGEVLEHTVRVRKILRLVSQCMKKDGHFIATVPWFSEVFRILPSVAFLREMALLKLGQPGPLLRLLFRNLGRIDELSAASQIKRRRGLTPAIFLLTYLGRRTKAFGRLANRGKLSAEDLIFGFYKGLKGYFGHVVFFTPNEWRAIVEKCGFKVIFESGGMMTPPIIWRVRTIQRVLSYFEATVPHQIRKWLSWSYVMACRSTRQRIQCYE